MCVCLCLRLTYLHLDLHAAVRELLNHAVNPYERLHLSDGERQWTRSEGGEHRAGLLHCNTHQPSGTPARTERDGVCPRDSITGKTISSSH